MLVCLLWHFGLAHPAGSSMYKGKPTIPSYPCLNPAPYVGLPHMLEHLSAYSYLFHVCSVESRYHLRTCRRCSFHHPLRNLLGLGLLQLPKGRFWDGNVYDNISCRHLNYDNGLFVLCPCLLGRLCTGTLLMLAYL